MITRELLSEIADKDQAIRAWSFLPEPATESVPQRTELGSGPLAGMIFGVKDVIDVRGMPTAYGADLHDIEPARFDAACVAMLRAAGATPVGKTVTAEFAVSAPGPTRNPWNLNHTPGGSSSGSAAAVAAGMVPMAIGTQTGGSIIRPAAFNGVVGFKPSFGRVPRTGMLVLCDSLDTVGWFTPDVALCRQVAEVFLGGMPSVDDFPANMQPGLDRLRVAVVTSLDAGTLEPAAMGALKMAAEDLAEHGAHTDWLEERELITAALSLHGNIMAYELARGLLPVMQSEPHALRAQTVAVIKRGLDISADAYLALQQDRLALQQSWAAKYAQYDVVLTPSAPGTAPAGLSTTGASVFNRTWSLLGWPSIHLPTAVVNGLPVGVQCVGRPLQDLPLLNCAEGMHRILDKRNRKRP